MRARGQRGVDAGLRDRGRPAGRRLHAAVRRGDQPAGRGRAVPAVVDGARACCGPWSTTPSGARATSASSRSARCSTGWRSPATTASTAERDRAPVRRVRRRAATTPGRRWPPGARWPTPWAWPTGCWSRARTTVPAARVLHEYRSAAVLAAPLGAGRAAAGPGRGGRARPDLRRDVRAGRPGRPPAPGGLARPRPRRPARPGRGAPSPARGRARSAGSRRRTSTSPSSCPTRCRPRWSRPTLVVAGGELLESVQLFDVYRGESLGDGAAQPRLPAAVLRPRPDPHRRGDRRPAGRLHRRGREGPPGRPALSAPPAADRSTWRAVPGQRVRTPTSDGRQHAATQQASPRVDAPDDLVAGPHREAGQRRRR